MTILHDNNKPGTPTIKDSAILSGLIRHIDTEIKLLEKIETAEIESIDFIKKQTRQTIIVGLVCFVIYTMSANVILKNNIYSINPVLPFIFFTVMLCFMTYQGAKTYTAMQNAIDKAKSLLKDTQTQLNKQRSFKQAIEDAWKDVAQGV